MLLKFNHHLPFFVHNVFGNNYIPKSYNEYCSSSRPEVNIYENETEFGVEVAAPGLGKEDFIIKVEQNLLIISSEKKEENENKNENYLSKEFCYSSFSRSFELPESVDQEKIEATHNNGILTVKLPKHEVEIQRNKSREISIS